MPRKCKPRSTALTAGAGGNANLLELAVAAARAKATVGEISFALEKSFGRYTSRVGTVPGVYVKEVGRAMRWRSRGSKVWCGLSEKMTGGAPKILVAKIGQDGHDRGQQVVASALADLGFDVIAGPLFATPEEAARQAAENNVHILGVSSLAAGHLTFMPQLRAALAREGRPGIMLAVGGVIPPQDIAALKDAGVAAIFPPGTAIPDAAMRLIEELNDRFGYRQREVAE